MYRVEALDCELNAGASVVGTSISVVKTFLWSLRCKFDSFCEEPHHLETEEAVKRQNLILKCGLLKTHQQRM
jgi:hypothetical protein